MYGACRQGCCCHTADVHEWGANRRTLRCSRTGEDHASVQGAGVDQIRAGEARAQGLSFSPACKGARGSGQEAKSCTAAPVPYYRSQC